MAREYFAFNYNFPLDNAFHDFIEFCVTQGWKHLVDVQDQSLISAKSQPYTTMFFEKDGTQDKTTSFYKAFTDYIPIIQQKSIKQGWMLFLMMKHTVHDKKNE